MYTVKWLRYPHGVEGEAASCGMREFETFSEAKRFLEGRFILIYSVYWAGGWIEDEKGIWLYEIFDTGETENYCELEEGD